jgi:hypothetical protein
MCKPNILAFQNTTHGINLLIQCDQQNQNSHPVKFRSRNDVARDNKLKTNTVLQEIEDMSRPLTLTLL